MRTSVSLLVAVALAAAGYSGVRWGLRDLSPDRCGAHAAVLKVTAAPDIAPAVTEAANRWNDTKPTSDGKCVRAKITSASPSIVANAMTAQYRSTPSKKPTVAGSAPAEAALSPDIWIPDSTSWLDRVRSFNNDAFSDGGQSTASSPLVVAAPEADAKSLGLGSESITAMSLISLVRAMRNGDLVGSPTAFQLGVCDPAIDTIGFATAQMLASLDSGAQGGLPAGGALIADYRFIGPIGRNSTDSSALLATFGSKTDGTQAMTAAVVSEQSVVAHNSAGSTEPLRAVPVAGVALSLDYPIATLSNTPSTLLEAATDFEAKLMSAPYQAIFAAHGFRAPDGTAGNAFPAGHGAGTSSIRPQQVRFDKKTAKAISLWTTATAQAQVLTMVDVSSSMGDTSPYKGASRLALTSAAAQAGLKLFTPTTTVGTWAFAPGMGSDDYQEVVPIEALAPNRARVFGAFAGAKPTASTGCGLYPALAAAYKKLRDGYVNGQINTIVVFTGCSSEPPDKSLSKTQLLASLENMADPQSPIRVVLINVGPSTNNQALADIAGTIGGKAVQLTDPAQITAVFMGALVALS